MYVVDEGVEGADAGEFKGGAEAAGEEQLGFEALDVEVVFQRPLGPGVLFWELEDFWGQLSGDLLAVLGQSGEVDDEEGVHGRSVDWILNIG